jgi:hypothetical protein|tara:strand:- start:444 stop:761 length:318 start_codon:yes stop_codon:yes gene_type:complete
MNSRKKEKFLLHIGKQLEFINPRIIFTEDQWILLASEIREICKSENLAEKVFSWYFSFSGYKYSERTLEDVFYIRSKYVSSTSSITMLDKISFWLTDFKKEVSYV